MKKEPQGERWVVVSSFARWVRARPSRRRRPAPLAGEAHADTESNDEKRKSRYRETEHVKTFYRVNRYPS